MQWRHALAKRHVFDVNSGTMFDRPDPVIGHAPSRPIKVVVVDDSLTIRRWLSSVFSHDERLQIVGMAGSAQEARDIIKATAPDVLTLDVEMPGMNGLDFLSHLMRLRPMPVVMLASGIVGSNQVAKQAMALGAVDCVTKPQFPTQETMSALRDRIYAAATGTPKPKSKSKTTADKGVMHDKILLVGASTGGVTAIETLLDSLQEEDVPPIVIAQHMPQQYLQSFVRRLDRLGRFDVGLSKDGMRLDKECVCLAPSQDHQTCVFWHSGAWHIQEIARQYTQTYCPSVDVLFGSAVPWAHQVGAVLLTGLGKDGARGMLALRQKGARTLGQSRDTCAVYGMPGAALSLNASEAESGINDIGHDILARLRDDKSGCAS